MKTSYTTPGNGDNFRFIRFITALAVCGTHCLWVVYGLTLPDTSQIGFLTMVSGCGVCLFFAMSGYLIAGSLSERPGVLRFTLARILRLCPMLFVVSLLTAFVLGPLVSIESVASYYGDWRVWAYVPLTTLTMPDVTLPGVFVNVPDPHEVNVSIWTLRYEILAYIGITIVSVLGLLTRQSYGYVAGLGLIVYAALNYGTDLRSTFPFFDHSLRWGLAFMFGSVLYVYRDIIPFMFAGVVAIIGLAYLTNDHFLMEPVRIAAIAYTTVWAANFRLPLVARFNSSGDYSYGLFVFHWPIAQTTIMLHPAIRYSELVMIAIPLALICAVFSWHVIEQPLISKASEWAKKIKVLRRPVTMRAA